MALKQCLHKPQDFCYVCGMFLSRDKPKNLIKINSNMCKAFESYFLKSIKIGKSWQPDSFCNTCKKTLEAWWRGDSRSLKWSQPRSWCEPTCHTTDCFFCMVKVASGKTKSNFLTLTVPSSSPPAASS